MPYFVDVPYLASVNEGTAVGTIIFTVHALLSKLAGDLVYDFIHDNSKAVNLFGIDPTTGNISVTMDLTTDRGLTYSV